MNCQTTRDMLGLYAGGDASPVEAARIEQHLQECAACRAELEEYRTARVMIKDIASSDMPLLPKDFTESVMAQAKQAVSRKQYSIWTQWPRIAAAACLLGMVGVLWYTVTRDIGRYRMQRLTVQREMVQVLVSRDPSLIEADRLAGYNVRGPIPLDKWEPSGSAGIFAILHKPDPENQPDLFSVDYIGEAKRIEYRGDPWRRQRINRLTERAGSSDNIYIAEYPMPQHSVTQRRAALNMLIDSLHPYYN